LNGYKSSMSKLESALASNSIAHAIIISASIKQQCWSREELSILTNRTACKVRFEDHFTALSMISQSGDLQWKMPNPEATVVEEVEGKFSFGSGELLVTVKDFEGDLWHGGCDVLVRVGKFNSNDHPDMISVVLLEDGRFKVKYGVEANDDIYLTVDVETTLAWKGLSFAEKSFGICSNFDLAKMTKRGWQIVKGYQLRRTSFMAQFADFLKENGDCIPVLGKFDSALGLHIEGMSLSVSHFLSLFSNDQKDCLVKAKCVGKSTQLRCACGTSGLTWSRITVDSFKCADAQSISDFPVLVVRASPPSQQSIVVVPIQKVDLKLLSR